MAQAEAENPNGPSIDAMLRGLTDRPNVQSTLILSKKDGSIIRATGLVASEKQSASSAGSQYQWPRPPQAVQIAEGSKEGDQATGGQEPGEQPQEKQTPVEILAASIFQFVNNAAALGLTLGSTSRDAGLSSGASYGDSSASKQEPSTEEEHPRSREDEVQLLRLRTKSQEIILFPDPNYICCVVQKIGKAGNPADRR